MGLYSTFTNSLKGPAGERSLYFFEKLLSAAAAGGLSALLATPADLALTRIQANNSKPKEARQNSGGMVSVLLGAWREGGIKGIYRGVTPTVVRAVLLNMGMLAVGDEVRQRFNNVMTPTQGLLCSSVVAGIVCAIVSLPADLVKTRLQSQLGRSEYNGMVHCAREIWSKEGFGGFFKGLGPYCSRIAPHGVITLILTPSLVGCFSAASITGLK